jgi:hypothetical protein
LASPRYYNSDYETFKVEKKISHQDTKAQRGTKKKNFSNKKTLGVLVPWWQ